MTQLRTLTWADFKPFDPCYDPKERYGDFSGTILDILKDKRIPAKDRIWAATCKGVLDDKTLRLFACKCVREVWHLLTDERSRKAVEVAERYAVGDATDEELVEAHGAACDAAGYTAGAVSGDAASSAARAAAMEAATGAAWDAAWHASWAAAREKQVIILIQLITNQ